MTARSAPSRRQYRAEGVPARYFRRGTACRVPLNLSGPSAAIAVIETLRIIHRWANAAGNGPDRLFRASPILGLPPSPDRPTRPAHSQAVLPISLRPLSSRPGPTSVVPRTGRSHASADLSSRPERDVPRLGDAPLEQCL